MGESVEQSLQENEYAIPYHYLPSRDLLLAFPQKLQTSPPYLLYLETIISLAGNLDKSGRLLDAGCGDGRLIWELRRSGCAATLWGIDYSQRAIQFARVFNPGVQFDVADLTKHSSLPETEFDVVVSVEMLEHIPPKMVSAVIDNLSTLVKKGGCLIITVPHSNRKIDIKHYQHFDSRRFYEILSPHFSKLEMCGFYKQSSARYLFLALVALYYLVYPLKKLGLPSVPKRLSEAGFQFFEAYLARCKPDEGNSLIAVCHKSP